MIVKTFKLLSRIAVLIILLVFSAGGSAFSEPASQDECGRLHDEIENDFKKANFCETDKDCKVIRLGGWYIDFGCYKFVNSATREDELFDKIERYKDKLMCSGKINDCASSGKPVCVNKKCVSKEKTW
jgi:hypothetical protein